MLFFARDKAEGRRASRATPPRGGDFAAAKPFLDSSYGFGRDKLPITTVRIAPARAGDARLLAVAASVDPASLK
ncbi:hypothetical protein [Cribrihabitans pelagius]|uniref:hypothetical protein n=1 Tax=Cribrihabitans pelagius TaxID=1765746 RepID=UPI003B597C8D